MEDSVYIKTMKSVLRLSMEKYGSLNTHMMTLLIQEAHKQTLDAYFDGCIERCERLLVETPKTKEEVKSNNYLRYRIKTLKEINSDLQNLIE